MNSLFLSQLYVLDASIIAVISERTMHKYITAHSVGTELCTKCQLESKKMDSIPHKNKLLSSND